MDMLGGEDLGEASLGANPEVNGFGTFHFVSGSGYVVALLSCFIFIR